MTITFDQKELEMVKGALTRAVKKLDEAVSAMESRGFHDLNKDFDSVRNNIKGAEQALSV